MYQNSPVDRVVPLHPQVLDLLVHPKRQKSLSIGL